MPKKNKREKILAELHRKSAKLHLNSAKLVNSQNPMTTASLANPSSSSFTYEKKSSLKPKVAEQKNDYAHVKHDLIKITIFTLIAFVFQGVLYFLLKRG